MSQGSELDDVAYLFDIRSRFVRHGDVNDVEILHDGASVEKIADVQNVF